mmetsp:Transcript_12379/g.53139  ORF Transcript_12379/g.53139 Transcript_12379/m.53139 type:complete len:289 (+) Transcript_12379:204-1070(+)
MVISTTRAILFLFFVSSDSSRREKEVVASSSEASEKGTRTSALAPRWYRTSPTLKSLTPSLRISAQIAARGFAKTLFRMFRRPRCAMPTTICSTPRSAEVSTSAWRPGIKLSAPSSPNRFALGKCFPRNSSRRSARRRRRKIARFSSASSQRPSSSFEAPATGPPLCQTPRGVAFESVSSESVFVFSARSSSSARLNASFATVDDPGRTSRLISVPLETTPVSSPKKSRACPSSLPRIHRFFAAESRWSNSALSVPQYAALNRRRTSSRLHHLRSVLTASSVASSSPK